MGFNLRLIFAEQNRKKYLWFSLQLPRKRSPLFVALGEQQRGGSFCLLSKAWSGGYCGLGRAGWSSHCCSCTRVSEKGAQAGHGSACDIHTFTCCETEFSASNLSEEKMRAAPQEYEAEADLSKALLPSGSTPGQPLAPAECILQMWPQNGNATGVKS